MTATLAPAPARLRPADLARLASVGLRQLAVVVCCDHGQMTHPSELPWKRALARLRERVDAGEWDHGERLPTIRDLGQQPGVSHGTVTRALRVLADEGVVIITPSYGTFRA